MADESAGEQRGKDPLTGQFTEGNPWRFPPGVSGNPDGNKHGSSAVAPLRRLMAADPNDHGEGKVAVETAQRLLDLMAGRFTDPKEAAVQLKAILAAVERVDGKVLQEVKNSGEPTHVTRVVVEMPDARK